MKQTLKQMKQMQKIFPQSDVNIVHSFYFFQQKKEEKKKSLITLHKPYIMSHSPPVCEIQQISSNCLLKCAKVQLCRPSGLFYT